MRMIKSLSEQGDLAEKEQQALAFKDDSMKYPHYKAQVACLAFLDSVKGVFHTNTNMHRKLLVLFADTFKAVDNDVMIPAVVRKLKAGLKYNFPESKIEGSTLSMEDVNLAISTVVDAFSQLKTPQPPVRAAPARHASSSSRGSYQRPFHAAPFHAAGRSKCSHCDKFGHDVDQCWTRFPEKRPQTQRKFGASASMTSS